MNTVRGSFTAKTLVRAKNDGLTPVALRAKRPLIAPSRPSVSRLGPLSSLLGAGKWGAGGRTTVRPALAPQLSLQALRLCGHFPRTLLLQYQYCQEKFSREDGLAWKPYGLHRSRWSRRPWDFHAIAPKGRLAIAPKGRLAPPRRTENGKQNAPTGRRMAFPRKRQGAKRRAAVAVSGEAAERPMEPEAVRASPCVFAVPIFPGQYWCAVAVMHLLVMLGPGDSGKNKYGEQPDW